jgi:tyrosyl-tRNA synthetase
MTELEKKVLLANAPVTTVSAGGALVEVVVLAGLATSKREARTFIESGAISINTTKITNIDAVLEESHFVFGVTILRRGKKHVQVLKVKS